MGAYHFKLYLVPAGVALSLDENRCAEGDLLKSFSVSDVIVQRLRGIFEKTNHWGDVEEYESAHEWGGDLRIWRSEEGQICDIEFRFAPVVDPIEKLREFVAIAKDSGCSLLEPSSNSMIAPDFDVVFQALRKHHSFRFLSDPKGALIEAAQKIKQDAPLTFRTATLDDCPRLAELNHQLIRDEGHRNTMKVGELEQRMRTWLSGEYRAVIYEDGGEIVAYALFREQPEEIYLRQLFVVRHRRNQGIGRCAVEILRSQIWPKTKRLTVEVLIANESAVKFWRSAGYADYALCLEILPD
jgi:hypothetical protein